jgi:aconitate hydratase
VRANYLASPPLVVAYSLAGTVKLNLTTDPIGTGSDGQPVYLKDIWPTQQEVNDTVHAVLTRQMFQERYGDVFKGPAQWQAITVDADSDTYRWNSGSTYVQNPPYFEGMTMDVAPIASVQGARVLSLLADSITTDHISPAGSIKKASPAGDYLLEHQVRQHDFNSYGARRGNHQVMMRGTFANIRIKNEMVPGIEGGISKHYPSGEVAPIYDVAMKYKNEGVPLVVFGGKEYGTGSSRDWAAKGTMLLGVKAVIAESFERIHRSNLVGMGVLPLVFKDGEDRKSLGLTGEETIDLLGIEELKPRMDVKMVITRADGSQHTTTLTCRVDTADEVEYYRNGGILHYVLRGMAKAA